MPLPSRLLAHPLSLCVAAGVAVAAVGTPATSATDGLRAAPDTLRAAATFDTVWVRIRDTHWDPEMGGLDWEAIRYELRPAALAAQSSDGLRAVIREMLGRLGESHFVLIPAETAVPPEGSAGGEAAVGLDLRWTSGSALVVRVEEGSPAEAAGIRPGFELLAVDGRAVAQIAEELTAAHDDVGRALPSYWITADLTRRLRGAPGEPLELELLDGGGERSTHRLARVEPDGETIRFGHLPPFRLRIEERTVDLEGGRRAGVLRFSGWFPAAAPAIAEAVDRFRELDGIVVDLRGNPGGLGGLVMGVGGHFLDERVELGTMRTRETTIRFLANPQRVAPDGRRVNPFEGRLAILVDGLSGSTSEIFAGGLQALGRARVFGEPTAGEALPALVVELPNGDRLMHAIADFTTPDGSRLEGRGVQPDERVTPDRESLLEGGDPVLQRALAWIAGAPDTQENDP